MNGLVVVCLVELLSLYSARDPLLGPDSRIYQYVQLCVWNRLTPVPCTSQCGSVRSSSGCRYSADTVLVANVRIRTPQRNHYYAEMGGDRGDFV